MLTPHMVHLGTIEAPVGRICQGNEWAIVDVNKDGARTKFVDENQWNVD